MNHNSELRPRHHALRIIELATKEERQQALAELDDDMRPPVEMLVRSLWPKVLRKSQESRP